MTQNNTPSWFVKAEAAFKEKAQKIKHGPFNEKKDELVLCFPADKVMAARERHGDEFGSSFAIAVELGPYSEFRPRGVLENDPTYIHPIVYFAVRKGDKVYVYSRGKTGGEDKLHDRASVGFGGHVGLEDATFTTYIESFDVPDGITEEEYYALEATKSRKAAVTVLETLTNAFRREFQEEIELASYTGNPKSDVYSMVLNTKVIYHSTGNVGCVHGVHLGFVSIIDIPEFLDDAILTPKENEGLGWYPISEETIEAFPEMEEWSKMVIRALISDTAHCMSAAEAEEYRKQAYDNAMQGIAQEEAIGQQLLDRVTEQMPELADMVESAINDPLVLESEEENPEPAEEPMTLAQAAILNLIKLASQHATDKVILEAGTKVTYFTETDLSETIIRLATDAGLHVEYNPADNTHRHTTVVFPVGVGVAISADATLA